jgi:N utilization substance protein B
MKARRASREIALLTLFQLEKQGTLDLERVLSSKDVWDRMVLAAIRALIQNAKQVVQDEATVISEFGQYIADVEMDHKDNENIPLEAPLHSVKLPTSQGMLKRVDKVLGSAEKVLEAMRFTELYALANLDDVRNHAIALVEAVQQNIESIDKDIEKYSEGWAINRLMKMDRALLRLTLAEMRFIGSVDVSISIDEAVALAKDYSEDENYKFINGVLGRIAKDAGLAEDAVPQLTA